MLVTEWTQIPTAAVLESTKFYTYISFKMSCPLCNLLPNIDGVLHDRHISLTLSRGVDGQLSRWNDKAFAQWKPHSFSQCVREPETGEIDAHQLVNTEHCLPRLTGALLTTPALSSNHHMKTADLHCHEKTCTGKYQAVGSTI